MDHFMAITATFAEHCDPEKARGMAHYMRDQFLFYGIQATQRRQLSRPWLKIERKQPIDCAWLTSVLLLRSASYSILHVIISGGGPVI